MAQMDDNILKMIQAYETPDSVVERLSSIQAVILTGITAAGKNTIMNDMLADERFSRVVTSTTRAPRENDGVMEQDGVDYYFLSVNQAQQKMQNGEYIEVANVHGRVNGSLVAEYERIHNEHKIALTDIDYQGAVRFLDFDMKNLLVLFVVPPSFETWLERVTRRAGGSLGDDKEDIIKRFRSAEKELAHALADPRFVPVMNNDSAATATQIIDFAVNGTRPTDQEVAEAHTVIETLSQAITDYINQLET